jgi:hypothetical protein
VERKKEGKMKTISDMVGKTFANVSGTTGGERLVFCEENGTKWVFYHDQQCCEHVRIDDIAGDLNDLIGTPLLVAEESTSESFEENINGRIQMDNSHTWTFYKFATVKGYVDVRWHGESNGYYSESVDLIVRIPGDKGCDEE